MNNLSVLLSNNKLSIEIIEIDFTGGKVLKDQINSNGTAIRESIVPCKIKIKNKFRVFIEKE